MNRYLRGVRGAPCYLQAAGPSTGLHGALRPVTKELLAKREQL